MSKKLLSLSVALCMLLQVFSMAVYANDTDLSEEIILESELEEVQDISIDLASSTEQFLEYFINDDFNTEGDLGNWVIGDVSTVNGRNITLEQTEEDGSDVMKFHVDKGCVQQSHKTPSLFNDFDDIELENNKIVIETRVKTTGGFLEDGTTAGNFVDLHINRPNDTDYLGDGSDYNYVGWAGGTIVRIDEDSINYKGNTSYSTTDLASNMGTNEWVNIKLEFDGTDGNIKDYTMTVWEDGDEENAVTTTSAKLNEYKNAHYDIENFIDAKKSGTFDSYTQKTQYDFLKSLSFTTVKFSNTIYVDYIRAGVYRNYITDGNDVSISSSTITPKQSEVTVQFTTNRFIGNIADDVVTMTDSETGDAVTCSVSKDLKNKTVTLRPESDLLPGRGYTITVDAEKFKTSSGFDLGSDKTFTVTTTAVNLYNVQISDEEYVMPGDTLEVIDYDYESPDVTDEGEHLYQWQKSSDGTNWENIDGAENATYTVDDAVNHGDYIRVVMTPKNISGETGAPAISLNAVQCLVLLTLPEDEGNFRKYHINDDYNTAGNVGNWAIGNMKDTKDQQVILTQETLSEDGNSIGALKFQGINVLKKEPFTHTQPAVINDFNDIKFESGSTIVIETRVKTLGGMDASTKEGAFLGLKFNRPNDPKYLVEGNESNFRGWNGGTLFLIKHDVRDPEKPSSGLRFKNNGSADDELIGGDFRNEWVNIKVVMDGDDALAQKYTVYALDDEGNVLAQKTGSLAEYKKAMYDMPSYVDFGNTTSKSKHEDLRSLSFVLREFSETVYVDYFKLYEIRPVETATVALEGSSLIRPSDSVTVKFEATKDIQSFPDGAVTIDKVETTMEADIENQTVTVKPVSKLTPGGSYIVRVNGDVIADSEGVIVNGQKTFEINVGTVNVYDAVTTGRIVPGKTMGISYVYDDSDFDEDLAGHTYQWQKSSNGTEWEDIAGQTNATYTVTNDIYEGNYYVRVTMIPKDIMGTTGAQVIAEYVVPETAPTLENLATNSTVLFPEMYLGPKYDYIDINDDKIVSKNVNWYISDSGEEGSWTLHSNDEYYYITKEDIGKYFKYDIYVTNDGPTEERNTSPVYNGPVVGPVKDIVAETNLLANPGFELGSMVGWKTGSTVIEIAGKEGARTGDYAAHLKPRTNQTDSWAQTVENLVTGKSYVLGGWVKKSTPEAVDIVNFWPYIWSGFERVGDDYHYLVQDGWVHAVGAIKATATSGSVDFVSFHTMKADAYIDDTYLGELVITDIETFDPDATEIPVDGTVKLSITSGKVLNQLGTTHGLADEKIKVRVPDGVSGIYLEGNDLVVDNTAQAGTYKIEVYCEPSYNDPAQQIFQKFITLTLLPNSDKAPKAREVKVSGEVKNGKTLTASYTFYQIDGEAEGASKRQWICSDTFDGTYTPIEGATGLNYTVDETHADKFIKFAVTPYTIGGAEGAQVLSSVITKARPPYATDVTVCGTSKVGAALEVSYKYNDYNNLVNPESEQGATTFQWYSSKSADSGFTPITGATGKTYTLTENEIDKYVKVKVTPASNVEPKTGAEAVESNVVFGPTAPTVSNVTFTKDGTTLTGSYKYNHKHGARETNSVYEWKVDGVKVSSSISYTINFKGTKYVEFCVTPIGDTNPSKGITVSYGMNITGSSSSTGSTGAGGGGGIGGGGGVGTTGVPSINDMKIPETEVKVPEQTQPKSDLQGHWGAEYVKEMETRGVMKADEKGNYDPDRTVSRSEMISYLFDALKLEEAEYKAEFSDVNALDGYAGKLQAMINNGTIASYHEFRPNDGISREEMCKILYVSLENAGKLTKAETNVLDAFADKASISDWAIDYVNTIYSNKIMIGTSETTFAPKENITRAQVATMLVRILKVIEG